MDPKTQESFVASLRELADFIEQKGEDLPLDQYDCDITVRGFLYDETDDDGNLSTAKSQMKQAARVLGKAEKVWSDAYLDLRKDFGSITLEFCVQRAAVCKRVVKGTEEVPEQVIPARTREIVEWICEDPILNS